MRRYARAAPGVACMLALGVACGSKAKGTFTVDFPSTATAIATDSMQVYAFDGSQAEACNDLVVKIRTRQALPNPIAGTTPISPCDLANGAGSIDLDYGTYAFLALGLHQQQDFVIGCEQTSVSSGGGSIVIEVALFDNTVTVPPTNCLRLSQFCAHGC